MIKISDIEMIITITRKVRERYKDFLKTDVYRYSKFLNFTHTKILIEKSHLIHESSDIYSKELENRFYGKFGVDC